MIIDTIRYNQYFECFRIIIYNPLYSTSYEHDIDLILFLYDNPKIMYV